MCLKFSKTSLLALVVGLYLELSIRKGICDDSQLTSSSYQQAIKDNKNMSYRHAHHSWKGWEEWLPSSTTENEQSQQSHNHDIPFSLSEQAKLRYRRNRAEKKFSSDKQHQHKSQPRSSKSTAEKTGSNNLQDEGDSIIDVKSLRDTAKTLAASLMNHFMTSWSSPDSHKSVTSESKAPRNTRAVYLDNLGERQDGPNVGKPVREAKRGVIDWVARLIGVQGKTLGEFLREYQVHVLYELAFTFFKWIFFLYAGLLIP